MTHSAQAADATNRYSDVVDLLLMRRVLHADELRDVRLACEEVFRARAEQAWPPTVHLPTSWATHYGDEARTVGLEETDLESAERALNALIAEIAAA